MKKISSYNITDVGYHYIGLRVIASTPTNRDEQLQAISRGVLKYASDRALRLMLPEPKGHFSSIGEKVFQELVHFKFAHSVKGAYVLTELGEKVLALLNEHQFVELRRAMVDAHLSTYANLRAVVQRHIEVGAVWRCTIEVEKIGQRDYIERLLRPTFTENAAEKAKHLREQETLTPKQTEDAVNQQVINAVFETDEYSVPLFRALCDRLVSLRLLNIRRVSSGDCEFSKSYPTCVLKDPPWPWYRPLNIHLTGYSTYTLLISEPDMNDKATLATLLGTIDEAFANLKAEGGYYDLPEVRDYVCEKLKIPEAAFDEGVNSLLDQTPQPLSPGLRYEGISARRKPLLRTKVTGQIHNLIRRT